MAAVWHLLRYLKCSLVFNNVDLQLVIDRKIDFLYEQQTFLCKKLSQNTDEFTE